MFEVVPKPEKPKGLLKTLLDLGFTPIESADWVVEQVHMHPVEYAELRKEAGDKMDIVSSKAVMESGVYAHLFGAEVHVSESKRRHHYEVVYGDLKLKNTVCLKRNKATGEDCPDLECLVDLVHNL